MRKAIATILCLVLLAVTAAGCAETTVDIFDTLSGLAWSYCSGAGAWSSDLQILADGTFTCEYHDSDMGDAGDNYPGGTVYFATFSGRMSLAEQVDENTWKIRVDELKKEPAEEAIEDGMRFVPVDGCGLGEGDVMTLYAPGTAVSVLSEDMQFWAHVMDQENPDELENWFLASEKNESGFVGYQPVWIANPWQDLTEEQLAEASGLRFGSLEDAENVVYRYLPDEGLAEMLLSRNGDEYCVRARKCALSVADEELIDISGMYFDWQEEEQFGFAKCYGVISRAQDNDTWVERVLWYDPDQQTVYSLAVYTADPGSLDLAGVAEKICNP